MKASDHDDHSYHEQSLLGEESLYFQKIHFLCDQKVAVRRHCLSFGINC